MRKLILQMQTSVDGYVGRSGDGPGWQVWNWGPECPWDAPLKARFNAVFQGVDTILFSRKILEGGYLNHWTQFAHDYGDNVNPVALREGLAIFKERETDANLQLREAKDYGCGVVVVCYGPRAAVEANA
jgi:hypothetical protein